MIYNHNKYKLLTTFQDMYLGWITASVFAITLVLNLGTTLLVHPTLEIPDIIMEAYLFTLIMYFAIVLIMYHRDYKKVRVMHNDYEEALFTKEIKVKDEYISKLGKEKGDKPLALIFAILPGLFYIFIGEYNLKIMEDGGFSDHDFAYGAGLFVLIIIYNMLIALNLDFSIFGKKDLLEEKRREVDSIETFITEIREHLKIFNPTSQFRLRVSNAVDMIVDIYVINMESLDRLESEKDLVDIIKKKNKTIKKELKKMLYSIIDYNNDRNEEILASIQKNIDIINSMRN